jgi:hypothetical protein
MYTKFTKNYGNLAQKYAISDKDITFFVHFKRFQGLKYAKADRDMHAQFSAVKYAISGLTY